MYLVCGNTMCSSVDYVPLRTCLAIIFYLRRVHLFKELGRIHYCNRSSASQLQYSSVLWLRNLEHQTHVLMAELSESVRSNPDRDTCVLEQDTL